MTKNKKPTMKDVAREAGVSVGTVSNVINGVRVRESYRKKVEDAIDTLHYEVNTYARGLKLAQSGLIALILPDVINPFYAAFANHVEAALYEKGKKMLLCCSDGVAEKEITYLNLVRQNKVDGIIALTYSDIGNDIVDDTPLVVFDRFFENHHIPRIASDNFSGACLAVEKLLEFGCRHPLYIRFHSVFPGEADKRKDGYLYACEKYNLKPDYLDMVDHEDWKNSLKAFIKEHRRADGSLSFDGVFAHTDFHGYHLMEMLQDYGYAVPEDVQIIGFDGIKKFGYDELFISSICQPIQKLAEKCVEFVLEKERSDLPSLTLLPVSYKYGGSTLK